MTASVRLHAMPAPRQVADRYVEIATADGKAALAELFAPDGVFHAPDGSVYRGREQIAAFYARHLATVIPTVPHPPRRGSGPATAGRSWPTLHSTIPVLLSSNHFTVDDDGFIARLAVFLRPH